MLTLLFASIIHGCKKIHNIVASATMALLNLLLMSCISFHLFVSALSDDSVSNIKVKYNGRNSPRCLTGNGTACQSLDYVFRNLHSVQAQSVIVSIASPQVVTVKSTVTSDGTTALTLLGANEDSSSRSDRISINFNMIKFNFPISISVTLQGLEIVDAGSLIFTCYCNNILINDCSLTSIDRLTIKPTSSADQTKFTVNSSLIHDNKFSSSGFLYYIPSGGNYPYYTLFINLYNTNFTKNTGKILTLVNETGVGFYGEIRVENCIFSGNTDPDFNFTITTSVSYGLNFNIINTVFNDNVDFSMIISLSGGGRASGVTFNLIGLNVTNNSNTTILTGDNLINNKIQLKDSLFSNNDGLFLTMNSSLGPYGCTVQVLNVEFHGNKRWAIDVHPQSSVSIANCSFIP